MMNYCNNARLRDWVSKEKKKATRLNLYSMNTAKQYA